MFLSLIYSPKNMSSLSTFPQVDVFMQRITFLESKITPCEQEAAQAGALREELEAKSQECADL